MTPKMILKKRLKSIPDGQKRPPENLCFIGTKIATKVLRDGQLVEVDANKGIVKILEEK